MSVSESLTAVADGIRAKTNTTAKIKLEEMPALIESIATIDPSWTDWRYFSDGNNRNSLVPKLKYADTSNGTDFSNMFMRSDKLEYVPDIDTSKGETFENMFYSNH